MSKKHKKLLKEYLIQDKIEQERVKDLKNMMPVSNGLSINVFADQDDDCVYIKMDGFVDFDDCSNYAYFLHEYLPLLLYKTNIIV